MDKESVKHQLANIVRRKEASNISAQEWAGDKPPVRLENLLGENQKLTDEILSALVEGKESEVDQLLAEVSQKEREHLEGLLSYLGERIHVGLGGRNQTLVHFIIPCVFYSGMPVPDQHLVLGEYVGQMLSHALLHSGLLEPEDYFRVHLMPTPYDVLQSLSVTRRANLGRDMLMGKINKPFLNGCEKPAQEVPKLLFLHGFVNNESICALLSQEDTTRLAENISRALNPPLSADIGFRLIASRPYPYSSALIAAPIEFIQLMVGMGERMGAKNMVLRTNGLFSESPESVTTEAEFQNFPFALPPLKFHMNSQDRRVVREALELRLKGRPVAWLKPS